MYNPYYFKTQSFTHLSVQETRETREKTRTRIFRAGSGQVSIKKFSGFSCHALEKPETSGRGGFHIFSGFCTLYPKYTAQLFDLVNWPKDLGYH